MRRRDKDRSDPISSDLGWMLGLFLLLVLAGFHVLFVYVLLAGLAAFAVVLVLRGHRRRRREQQNAGAPFWADRLRGR